MAYGQFSYGQGEYGGGLGPGSPTASDSLTISDVAARTAISTHLTTSDSVSISDTASSSSRVAPASSLYKRYPGVGGRATPRTRNPVNLPRSFGTSRLPPPRHYDIQVTDSIPISDSAAPVAGFETFSISDSARASAQPGHVTDPIPISDGARTSTQTKETSDSLSVTDAPGAGLNPADSWTISDACRISGYGMVEPVPISDSSRVVSQPAYSSDTIPITDRAAVGPRTFDTIAFAPDGASAGPIFFSGSDSFTIADVATFSVTQRVFIFQEGNEVLFVPPVDTILYQDGIEVGSGLPSDTRVYQDGSEVALQPPSNAYIFQDGEEVGFTPPADTKIFQDNSEVAFAADPWLVIAQEAIEIGHQDFALPNVGQIAMEVAVHLKAPAILQEAIEVAVPNLSEVRNYPWWFARRMQYRR